MTTPLETLRRDPLKEIADVISEMDADIFGPRPRQIPKSWPDRLRAALEGIEAMMREASKFEIDGVTVTAPFPMLTGAEILGVSGLDLSRQLIQDNGGVYKEDDIIRKDQVLLVNGKHFYSAPIGYIRFPR